MGWHFHNRIDYIGDSFSIELLASLKNGVTLFWGYGRGTIFCQVGSDQDRISPYNIKYDINQTSDEHKDSNQILQTNITRTTGIWQTVQRITDEILGVKGLRVQIPIFTFGSPWAESKPADTKTRSGSNWTKFHKQQILRVVFNLSNNPVLLRLWCLQKFFLWLRKLCTPHPKPIKQKMNNWSIKLYIYLFEFLLAPYSIYFGSGWLTF